MEETFVVKPMDRQPNFIKNAVRNSLIRMARLRLHACDREGVEIVVETGIGLGVFAGNHIGIDAKVRQLSAQAIRFVLQQDGLSFKNIRAVVFALPIFRKRKSKLSCY